MIFDDYQGANLVVGGKVVDNCLVCPFHLWRFDGTGKCTHIPYQDKIPQAANTKSWVCVEAYGMIWVWYDADGRPPAYEMPIIPGISDGKMAYRGRRDRVVKMHLQEFAENSADFQHFGPLHGQMVLPFTNVVLPLLSVHHNASWHMDESQPHVAYFINDAELKFRGKVVPRSGLRAKITFFGPGGLIWFTFSVPHYGDIIMFHLHTPLTPLKQQVSIVWFAEKQIPRPLVWYVVGSWVGNWLNDIDIWENKIHQRKPVLVRGDGPIMQLRRWYRQFYSPSSVTRAQADEQQQQQQKQQQCTVDVEDW